MILFFVVVLIRPQLVRCFIQQTLFVKCSDVSKWQLVNKNFSKMTKNSMAFDWKMFCVKFSVNKLADSTNLCTNTVSNLGGNDCLTY